MVKRKTPVRKTRRTKKKSVRRVRRQTKKKSVGRVRRRTKKKSVRRVRRQTKKKSVSRVRRQTKKKSRGGNPMEDKIHYTSAEWKEKILSEKRAQSNKDEDLIERIKYNASLKGKKEAKEWEEYDKKVAPMLKTSVIDPFGVDKTRKIARTMLTDDQKELNKNRYTKFGEKRRLANRKKSDPNEYKKLLFHRKKNL